MHIGPGDKLSLRAQVGELVSRSESCSLRDRPRPSAAGAQVKLSSSQTLENLFETAVLKRREEEEERYEIVVCSI